ncbi:MAG: DoxX family protein, partial [Alistipes sp.]|nr:DoxX family protein [Alistipes sp.]
MDKQVKQTQQTLKRCSVAILFLRLFIGAMMLLHIIGKMQSYDNLVLEYNSFLGLSRSTSLALSMIVEGVLAAMIIIGMGTRMAAMLMIVATCVSLTEEFLLAEISMDVIKIEILYLGVFITLTISGGGTYAFNI